MNKLHKHKPSTSERIIRLFASLDGTRKLALIQALAADMPQAQQSVPADARRGEIRNPKSETPAGTARKMDDFSFELMRTTEGQWYYEITDRLLSQVVKITPKRDLACDALQDANQWFREETKPAFKVPVGQEQTES